MNSAQLEGARIANYYDEIRKKAEADMDAVIAQRKRGSEEGIVRNGLTERPPTKLPTEAQAATFKKILQWALNGTKAQKQSASSWFFRQVNSGKLTGTRRDRLKKALHPKESATPPEPVVNKPWSKSARRALRRYENKGWEDRSMYYRNLGTNKSS